MKKKLNILLVEDDIICVQIIERAFIKMKVRHILSVVSNGEEALQILKDREEFQPNLILLDVEMPKMNGIEFLQKLRSLKPHASIPVFMLTSRNDFETRQQAFDHNVAGYILKPLLFDDYLEALETLNSYWELMEMNQTL